VKPKNFWSSGSRVVQHPGYGRLKFFAALVFKKATAAFLHG
jgi:hypothetical protein